MPEIKLGKWILVNGMIATIAAENKESNIFRWVGWLENNSIIGWSESGDHQNPCFNIVKKYHMPLIFTGTIGLHHCIDFCPETVTNIAFSCDIPREDLKKYYNKTLRITAEEIED